MKNKDSKTTILRYVFYTLLGCVMAFFIYTTENKNKIYCKDSMHKRILIFKLKNSGIYKNLDFMWINDGNIPSMASGEYMTEDKIKVFMEVVGNAP